MNLKSSDCNAWPILTEEEIQERMSTLTMWKLIKGENSYKLVRDFTCKNFQCCLNFISAAGAIAEERGHHPDLHLTEFRNMKIEIFSHGLSALTDNDFNLCRAIDTIKIEYSPKFLKSHPECHGTEISL